MSNDYHEKETIRLTAREPKSRRDLHVFLKRRGFRSQDDFYFIDRPDTPKPWQGISVVTVNVFHRGSAIYQTEEDIADGPSEWDELSVDYLMASLPASFIEKCAVECEALAAQFDLQTEFDSAPVEPGMLRPALQQIADTLTAELDEPGSEALGILIEMKYSK